jgi:septal ring factor EnvC (AmiA/AmiB activator)
MCLSVAGSAAGAQTRAATAPIDASAKAEREAELSAVQDQLKRGIAQREALAADIERLRRDRETFSAELVETANRARAAETETASAEARVQDLARAEAAIQRSLLARRDVIVEVLAALQRMGRKPPPAVLVRPEDILQAVRTSMILGIVLPDLKSEAEALASDLAHLVTLRDELGRETASLRQARDRLFGERERLSSLVAARQTELQSSEAQLVDERRRNQELIRQARTLKDLIERMEAELTARQKATDAARAAPTPAQPPGQTALLPPGVLRDPARLQPRTSFGEAKGRLLLPVNGIAVRQFGAQDSYGGSERGLSLQAEAGALVTSPADGRIVFSGTYRSYGHVLIINAGDGYHLVLAGLGRVSVEPGQFVLAGEPVAAMGASSAGAVASASPVSVTAAANEAGAAAPAQSAAEKPVLYIEFRKDGSPVDPGPWWAKSPNERPDNEKARG